MQLVTDFTDSVNLLSQLLCKLLGVLDQQAYFSQRATELIGSLIR